MKPSKSIKGKKLIPKELKKHVLWVFSVNPKKRMTAKQVIKKLKIANNGPSVHAALRKLAGENKLIEMSDGKFRLNKHAQHSKHKNLDTYTGIVDMIRSGSAYISVDELPEDVFVASRNLNSAMNGDRVNVGITRTGRGGRPEGIVVEILERATEHFIGTIKISKHYGFVIPDSGDIHTDIYVAPENTMGAKDGETVVVRVIDWSQGSNRSPVGKVTSVLGAKDSADMAMKSILINNGFELEFPDDVLRESEAISEVLDEAEIARRRDMREVTTFTIDPLTAKDFDDALSIRWLDNGNCEVGVHIADVAHYVKEHSPLDKEALKRSTSVYLVDRVLPMLPEKLSNGVCSLRPHEDKFTFSAIFEFDKNDKITNRWFGRTVTHSDRRFTYEEAQEVLETGEGDFKSELKFLNRLAKKLRVAKFKNGAISFEQPEVKFKLDESGKPLSVYVKERKDAHMLIEDFMLLANKEVARFVAQKGMDSGKEIPMVYRTHDSPDPAKLADFALFAKSLGYTMDVSNPKVIASALNKLTADAKERPELKMLEPLAIRTMAKAEYTTNNIGHYGLAFDYYSHFTSPIRRYSDVLTHRILDANLKAIVRRDKAALEEQCKHISRQERKAMTAERESVRYKQVEYIKDNIGETFNGRVTGMIESGFFVEMEGNRCEGFVPVDSMPERYVLQDGRMRMKARSGAELRMGDTVRVTIISASVEKRRIELRYTEEE